jgi:hypothetical protein
MVDSIKMVFWNETKFTMYKERIAITMDTLSCHPLGSTFEMSHLNAIWNLTDNIQDLNAGMN